MPYIFNSILLLQFVFSTRNSLEFQRILVVLLNLQTRADLVKNIALFFDLVACLKNNKYYNCYIIICLNIKFYISDIIYSDSSYSKFIIIYIQ